METLILSCEYNDKVIKVVEKNSKYVVSNNGDETYCINLHSATTLYNKLIEEKNNVA